MTSNSMSFLKLRFLCTWLCFFFISNTTTQAANYLYHNCSTNKTFTSNSPFHFNLKTLLSSLSSNATGATQFYNTTVYGGNPSDNVFGLFMCRGDVTNQLCRDCVANAAQRLAKDCPFSKEAITWYDECLVRYSSHSFFSTVTRRPRLGLLNTANISNPEKFMTLLYQTMNKTADEAANKGSAGIKKYATSEANFSVFQTLYCLAQCTPDLSVQDCRMCLENVIGDLSWCCTFKQGGRVLYPSCNVRYEIYPFYGQIETTQPPSSPTPHRGKKGVSAGRIIAIVVPVAAVSLLLVSLAICLFSKRGRKKQEVLKDDEVIDITTLGLLQFDFSTLEAATEKFSDDKKLGEGGFGVVYKGTLSSGQAIAVKRLKTSSLQGADEFKTEVVLASKLQHKNLVKFLGFCLEGEEKILVYDYVPNKSLDKFLYGHERKELLDWSRRSKIIGGIARGVLYLHEDSQLRVIHRDLKASNILLDEDMNPKICGFSIARTLQVKQTQGDTSKIVGTHGYMSPEYAMYGEFSVKSDVYSFGVLIMEIISGKKNSAFYQPNSAEDLLNHAWKLWKEGKPLEMLDPALRNSYSHDEVIRCIHIGLLCVQKDPSDRPIMATIVLMLNSSSVILPAPRQPAFLSASNDDPYLPMKDQLECDESQSQSIPYSVNEMSTNQVKPR